MKYVKYINEQTVEYPPKNKGDILNYNLDFEQLILDGYKELVEAPKEEGKEYILSYVDTEEQVIEIATEVTPEDIAHRREQQFNKEFFNTSLGYIRRAVTMKDGSKKDFLSDLLPTIAIAVNSGVSVSIIAYNKPESFMEEITDWTQYQHIEMATAQFIQDCSLQLNRDFVGG